VSDGLAGDSATRRATGGPLQLPTIVLETGAGLVPVALDRDGPRIVFGRMTQPLPTVAPHPDPDAHLGALGVTRSELPVERYTNGPRHVYVMLAAETQVARLAPDFPAWRGSATRRRTASLAPSGAGRRARLPRATASPRTRRPARPRARSPATSPATGASPSATRSRSTRAPRSDGPARCTPGPRARGSGSRRSRSAAPPSWPAASSACRERWSAPGRARTFSRPGEQIFCLTGFLAGVALRSPLRRPAAPSGPIWRCGRASGTRRAENHSRSMMSGSAALPGGSKFAW